MKIQPFFSQKFRQPVKAFGNKPLIFSLFFDNRFSEGGDIFASEYFTLYPLKLRGGFLALDSRLLIFVSHFQQFKSNIFLEQSACDYSPCVIDCIVRNRTGYDIVFLQGILEAGTVFKNILKPISAPLEAFDFKPVGIQLICVENCIGALSLSRPPF